MQFETFTWQLLQKISIVEASRFLKNATPTPGGLRPDKGVGISESAATPAPYKLSYPYLPDLHQL